MTIPSRSVADASAVSYCSNARAIEVQEFLLEYNHKASHHPCSAATELGLADFEEGVGLARPTQSASRLAQPLSPPTSRPLWHSRSMRTASTRSTSPSTCAASSAESCARCKSLASGRSAIGGRSSARASVANNRLDPRADRRTTLDHAGPNTTSLVEVSVGLFRARWASVRQEGASLASWSEVARPPHNPRRGARPAAPLAPLTQPNAQPPSCTITHGARSSRARLRARPGTADQPTGLLD